MVVLFALFLAVAPADTGETDARCDSLYTAARSAREQVIAGKDQVHTTEGAQQRWQQTVRRFLTLTRDARQCYGPLPAPAADSPQDAEMSPLPSPGSRQRERLMMTYDWAHLAYRELQQYEKSFAEFDVFFEHFGASADSARISWMYQKRGYLHYRLGNLSESIDDYTSTLAYIPLADTLRRIDVLTDLGIILQKVHDLKRAQQYYRQAEKLARALPPSDRARSLLARVLQNQGDILLKSTPGRDSLQTIADRRLAIQRLAEALDLYPPDATERRARAHIVLGEAHSFDGNRDAALHHLQRGQALAERLNHPDVLALSALKRGKAHLATGEFDLAEALLRGAVRYAQSSSHNGNHRRALNNLGRLYERQADWPAAEVHYRRAIEVAEKLRASLRATDWATGAFDQWSDAHRGLVRVLVAQERHEEAFRTLERTRARHLQDLRMQARLTSTMLPRERVRFDSLTAALAEVRNVLAAGGLSQSERSAYVSQEVRLMAERRAVLDLDASFSVPSIKEVRARLAARGRTLVAYYLDDPDPYFGRAPQSFAFVLTPDTLHTVPLDVDQAAITSLLTVVSPLLTGEAGVDLNSVQFNLDALHRLYRHLYAPVAERIPPDAPLVVVPDGPLFRLPLGMLVEEAPSHRFAYDEARFLIHARPIAAELSATLLADTSNTDLEFEHDLVALGRSRFDTLPRLPSPFRSRVDSAGGLSELPAVRRELDALDGLFAHRRILLDDDATEERLRALQDRSRILHLASHALVHPSDPLANAFVLTPAPDAQTSHDGLLFLHEMERQNCPIPLVVLSGCSTAQGLLQTGEGPRGLQYAFRAAGAQSTLATLWDIDDDAALALTTAFYKHLRDGAPKDVALRRAQLDFIAAHPQKASPFFWAGAVLYGDTRPLSLTATAPIPLAPLAAGGIVLLLVASGIRYLRSRRHAS